MRLIFEEVSENDEEKIHEVYEIIRLSGQDMFFNQGLLHWKKPYPIEFIRNDCVEKHVFLAKDLGSNTYVHTFQLDFMTQISNGERKDQVKAVSINKFATLPSFSGKGIGKKSFNHIEKTCLKQGISKIVLEVYDKSEHAIQFYKKRGFRVIGERPTRNFTVLEMEKHI